MKKAKKKTVKIMATDIDPSEVVQVAVAIKKLNERQTRIQDRLSKLGTEEAALNGEFREIQLKRADLQRRFDSVSRPG
jgi:predicted nuclease with TOPRIM domain